MTKQTPDPHFEFLPVILATNQQRIKLDTTTMLRENNKKTPPEKKEADKQVPSEKKFTHLYVFPSNY